MKKKISDGDAVESVLTNFVARGHAAQAAADKAVKQSRAADPVRSKKERTTQPVVSSNPYSDIAVGEALSNKATPAVPLSVSYARCELVTNVPMRCPFCGELIVPHGKGKAVRHVCRRPKV